MALGLNEERNLMACTLDTLAQVIATDLAAGHTTGIHGGSVVPVSNPARLSEAVNVTRSWWPVFHPAKLQTVDANYVTVMPLNEQGTRLSRGVGRAKSVEYRVTLAVCRKLSAASRLDNDAIGAAMATVEELLDFFFCYELSNPIATWTADEVIQYPDHERIKEQGVVFALWDMVLQGTRSAS